MGNVTIVGSINMDMVTSTAVFPKQGETIKGESFVTMPGGKGANQAVAAARLGASVRMIGRVGDDPFGKILTDGLGIEGVDVSNVEPVTDCSSGIASIILSDQDNRIIITPGANDEVTVEYINQFEQVLAESDVVLLQLEIPLDAVERTLTICQKHRTKVILNPAPAYPLSDTVLSMADYITPNETEYELLFKDSNEYQGKIIVTEGEAGVSWHEAGKQKRVAGHSVQLVDTTGAGDTFNGALAASLSNGESLEKSIVFANAAAALSVQSLGAQSGMPTREEVQEHLSKKELT
ncbi:ribokinase [Alkalicoccobacillus gibsonii]|uniref:ribokinase n=1 Tax=Alkalicoccobacillus gibsonii TaxID=79881 RepID=UPI0019334DF1|nr:ribokinase [Alkalicoccobacillus gibsonii]MBM0067086.1 ribokinase [Alkalicoccobacillus gibsonii]